MSFWKNIKTMVYRELFQQLHILLLIFQLNLSFKMWKEYATWNVIFNMNFTSQLWHHRINWKVSISQCYSVLLWCQRTSSNGINTQELEVSCTRLANYSKKGFIKQFRSWVCFNCWLGCRFQRSLSMWHTGIQSFMKMLKKPITLNILS